MKLGIFVAIAVLGLLTLTEGKFPRLRIDPHGRLDPEDADEITSQVENAVNEEWQKYSEEDTEGETVFTATELGSDIRGKLMYTLKEERKIYAYQGFRFGKAERFSPPEDLGNYWSEHLGDEAFNATHIGLKCPQGSGGDEDCLFLNVYTPFKPGTDDAQNLTVMFFIHGGAFVAGDATKYLPTKLLSHDVILVTTHYRLGAFGFYTRNSPKAPGNLAFYDMISALRWVQKYISDFGGNPELVTIFGESAGSVSVNYMMLLTKEENLFRAVIAESGSALDHWAFDEDYTYATEYYEHYVGCDIYETEDEILDCMRNVPYLDLLKAGQTMIREDRINGLIGFRGCSPTIQEFNDTGLDFKNILYQHPRDFMINRDFKDVPFMTGANREEGSLIVGITLFDYLIPNNLLLNTSYLREGMLRDLLLSVGISDEPEGIAKSLQRIYCDGVDLAKLEEAQYCLIDIGGILFLKAGSWQMSNYHSYFSTHKNKTFYYSFEFESDDMVGAVGPEKYSFYAGVAHADELKYLFSAWAIMDAENGQEDIYQRMTLMWTNFARYLDPTPDEDIKWESMGIPKWIPYRFEEPHFLLIDRDFSMMEDYSERWTITNELYGPQPPESDECVGVCADYEDQRQAFMITMIVFIVAFVISCLGAIFFFFKARG